MNALTPFRSLFPSWRTPFGREFADLFDRMAEWETSRVGDWNPFLDVIENPESFVVKAEVPGLKSSDIHINLSGETLTIHGEKKREEKKEGENFHLVERMEGNFARTVRFASPIRQDGVDASLKDGILTVTVHKAQPARSTEIKVKQA